MVDMLNNHLESFLTFLIDRHIVDNSGSESETLSKFLQLFEQFEEQNENSMNLDGSLQDEESQVIFETRAIFTLADFLKQLSANEYYDIAQKCYNQWTEQDIQQPYKKLEQVIKIKQRVDQSQIQNAFLKWKHFNDFYSVLDENDKLKEYIHMLTRENEALSHERNILELQTKKRNQTSNQHIQPLRQSRRVESVCDNRLPSSQRSAQKMNPLAQSMQPIQFDNGVPIHERLHREAYKKNQQQVINDVIKERSQLRDCTFKPNTGLEMSTPQSNAFGHSRRRSSSRGMSQQTLEDPFIFDRLSKSTRKFNPEIIQLQKDHQEMQECTFHPQTNSKSKDILNSYQNDDGEQVFERLHREAQEKEKFIKGMQMLKEQAEVNQCTFQPDLPAQKVNQSLLQTQKSQNTNSSHDSPFTRLHQEHEVKQRSLLKIESSYNEKFKESHPFQPTRVHTKDKDPHYRENSKQRADRMYQQWRDKEAKIQQKRQEMQKEEEKLHKLTLVAKHKKCTTSAQSDQFQTISDSQNDTTHQSQVSTLQPKTTHDRLYTSGKDKARKQDELRQKLYKEQGYVFTPQVCQNNKYQQSKGLIDRNQDFIQKKENHIKEIAQQQKLDFQPQRVTTKSKLAQPYNENLQQQDENWGDRLYQKGAEIEQKNQKARQEHQQDKNCTFKPQLAKKTNKILRESSQTRVNQSSQGSLQSKSSQSLGHSYRQTEVEQQTQREPFSNYTNKTNH